MKICPHCNKPDDGGAITRAFGQTWHLDCWVPWLEAKLAGARKDTP